MTRYHRDTAVARAADGAFDVRIDSGWWIVVGPNGGYVAALVLHAMEAALGDPARAPRSLTLHYVSTAVEGAARVLVRIERSGRSMSALSARLEQNGRLIALALASFGHTRERLEFQELAMPTVTPPEDVTARLPAGGKEVPLRARFEMRPVYDTLVGGWMRFAEPQVPDAAALAMFCDSWPPVISRRAPFGPDGIRGVPTIDLTIHFRAALPVTARPNDFYLCAFRTRTAREGFLEEDGEIWTRDGLLLAQSRQLALLV